MSHKTKTIVCRVSDYYPYSGLNGYRFIREYRHWIVGLMHYVHLGIRQPTWQIKDEIYTLGFIPPRFPVPAVVCKVVQFPEGNPFTEFPNTPYINWLQYNGKQGLRAPGYRTVQRLYLMCECTVTDTYDA